MNRISLASGIALVATTAAFATSARVESMGKNATYFQDDANIWLNPAEANLYPNYLLGELGQMRGTQPSSSYTALERYNNDPTGTWFGAIFAKSLSKDETQTGRYPQVLIGGAFNRDDEWLSYMPTTVTTKYSSFGAVRTDDVRSYNVSNFPIKWDGILGFATDSGQLYGLKTYFAYMDSTYRGREVQSVVNTYTLGTNIPFGAQVSLEANATIGFLSVTVTDTVDANKAIPNRGYKSDLSPSFGGDVRAFIDAHPFPIVVVPAASFRLVNAPSRTYSNFRLGSGANVSLDRGFFWMGVDYFQSSDEVFATDTSYRVVSDSAKATTIDENGLRVSFGIERNIWTDWFVIRVGGQKVIKFRQVTGNGLNTTVMTTNPERNDPDNDLVSFGFGLNIEDKLKVDAVVAKDILFTGGSLLGGPADHVLSRISASYSF